MRERESANVSESGASTGESHEVNERGKRRPSLMKERHEDSQPLHHGGYSFVPLTPHAVGVCLLASKSRDVWRVAGGVLSRARPQAPAVPSISRRGTKLRCGGKEPRTPSSTRAIPPKFRVLEAWWWVYEALPLSAALLIRSLAASCPLPPCLPNPTLSQQPPSLIVTDLPCRPRPSLRDSSTSSTAAIWPDLLAMSCGCSRHRPAPRS